MIDRILTAAYPEGAPMTVSRLTSWALLGEDHLEPVERDADGKLVSRSLYFHDDAGSMTLGDAFVRYAYGSRVLFARSWFPLALIVAIAAIGLWLGWLFWNPPDLMEHPNQMLFLDIVLTIAAICFTARWLNVLVKLKLTMRDPDSYSSVAPITALDPETLERLRAASGLSLYKDVDLSCTTTLRGRRRAKVAIDANRKLREGLQAVADGKLERVNGAHNGTSYNPRDISLVKLEKAGGWIRLLVLLLYIPACALPLALLAGAGFLFDLGDGPVMTFLFFIASMLLFIWGLFIPAALAAMWTCQWLLGTWWWGIDPFSPLDHRVRIRSRAGRWTTLLHTGQHAVAVEVYNQIARDIRQPLD